MGKQSILFLLSIILTSCTPSLHGFSFSLSQLLSSNDAPTWKGLPVDEREVTFPNPADMDKLGWSDVTRNGSQVLTYGDPAYPNGCPDALPNQSDSASKTQTTSAIQCRLTYIGKNYSSGSLFFPKGTYYINHTLSLSPANVTQGLGPAHVSGEDPVTTKIVWAGDCGTPDSCTTSLSGGLICAHDMLEIDNVYPLVIERLTLDGQGCASNAIHMNQLITGANISEMNIENLTGNGIFAEVGMVSEVTVTQSHFNNIAGVGVFPDNPLAVDWWIRDSVFSNSAGGLEGGNGGNFDVSNSFFENNGMDMLCGNGPCAARNNYSTGSQIFIDSSGLFYAQGNTVIAPSGALPIRNGGGFYGQTLGQLTLIQNNIFTQNNDPAINEWTMLGSTNYEFGWQDQLAGVSAAVGIPFDESYSNLVSIGNHYSSTQPFATTSNGDAGFHMTFTSPGWSSSESPDFLNGGILGCGPTGTSSSEINNRTYCVGIPANADPFFNLLTFDDVVGAQTIPTPPPIAPFRPVVQRNYIIPTLMPVISGQDGDQILASANANSVAIQSALNKLAANQSNCAAYDYTCLDRWGILFLPAGKFAIATTIDVPGSVQLQIVGTGNNAGSTGSMGTNLYWLYSSVNSGWISGPQGEVFKFHAPSHVMMRDFTIVGAIQGNWPASYQLGEGVVAEVTDLNTSRVLTDNVRLLGQGTTIVNGMGNAAFEMRSFGMTDNGTDLTQNLINGNNGANSGYFAIFGGNPMNLTLGGGANLMLQDAWYEGSDTSLVTCQSGNSGNITLENSLLAMGGWHGVYHTANTTFNLGTGCKTKMAALGSYFGRQGWGQPDSSGNPFGPMASLVLPASATAATQVLFLNNGSTNSTYGTGDTNESGDTLPSDYTGGAVDQGYLKVDPASQAQVANASNTFLQATGKGTSTAAHLSSADSDENILLFSMPDGTASSSDTKCFGTNGQGLSTNCYCIDNSFASCATLATSAQAPGASSIGFFNMPPGTAISTTVTCSGNSSGTTTGCVCMGNSQTCAGGTEFTTQSVTTQIAAQNTGTIQSSFIRLLLGQAIDPRQSAASRIVAPITDMQSTDIQMTNVYIYTTLPSLQFILPGSVSQ